MSHTAPVSFAAQWARVESATERKIQCESLTHSSCKAKMAYTA